MTISPPSVVTLSRSCHLPWSMLMAVGESGMSEVGLPLPAQGLGRLVLVEGLTDCQLRVCYVTSNSTSCLARIPSDANIRPGHARSAGAWRQASYWASAAARWPPAARPRMARRWRPVPGLQLEQAAEVESRNGPAHKRGACFPNAEALEPETRRTVSRGKEVTPQVWVPGRPPSVRAYNRDTP